MQKDTQTQTSFDVIIVGGGASGIGAAVTLREAGVSYLILQAQNRIGGRLKSAQLDGVQIDLGGCWVHSYNEENPIRKYIQKFNWKPKKKRLDQDQVYDQQEGQCDEQLYQRCENLSNEYFQQAKKFAEEANEDLSIYEAGKEYYKQNIQPLKPKQRRLANLLINNTEELQAASIQELSALHFADQQDQGEDFEPQKSYASLMAKIAQGVSYQCNSVVTEVKYSQDGVLIKCSNSKIYKAKKVIISVSLGLLKQRRIKFIPQLPQEKLQNIDNIGFGLMNKIIVSFEEPFWDKKSDWIHIACNQRGRHPSLFNCSTQDKHILCCFATGNYARKISSWSDQQIINDLLSLLQKVYQTKIAIRQYIITRWDKEQFSKGSYSHYKVNSSKKDAQQLRKPIFETLWFVGQHCYAESIGSAHGAFETGKWAAEEIIQSLNEN